MRNASRQVSAFCQKCGFGLKFYNAENHNCENSAVKISGVFWFLEVHCFQLDKK